METDVYLRDGDDRKNGFTLIELIIVIVIVSMLILIALPRFINFSGNAEDAVLKNSLGALRAAARIAESANVATGQNTTGIVRINNAEIGFLHGFPVARAANISATGPGDFDGILRLIELEGGLQIHYSDDTPVVSETQARTAYLILEMSRKCIFYRPPQTAGALPEYSQGILVFDPETKRCE